MGTPLAGVGGNAKLAANTIANLGTWSLDQGANTEKTTSFGATGSWETNQTTLKNWSAKCGGRLDVADTNGQVALINGLGNTFTLNLYVDATHYWGGSAILVGIGPKVDVNGLEEVEFSFTGTGVCTYT